MKQKTKVTESQILSVEPETPNYPSEWDYRQSELASAVCQVKEDGIWEPRPRHGIIS